MVLVGWWMACGGVGGPANVEDSGTLTGAPDSTPPTFGGAPDDTGTPVVESSTPPDGCLVPPIPSNALVADRDDSLAEDELTAWVCRNKTLSASGSGSTFFVEQNGELVLSGSESVIYAESGADIAIFGEGNTIYTESGVDLLNEAPGTTRVNCTVEFDLSVAPDPGC